MNTHWQTKTRSTYSLCLYIPVVPWAHGKWHARGRPIHCCLKNYVHSFPCTVNSLHFTLTKTKHKYNGPLTKGQSMLTDDQTTRSQEPAPISYMQTVEKKVTYLCVARLLLDSTTVLEGLFGEYHSSSAALGKQRLGVTKQPRFSDWGAAATLKRRWCLKLHFARTQRKGRWQGCVRLMQTVGCGAAGQLGLGDGHNDHCDSAFSNDMYTMWYFVHAI